jgi:hypothetical protein
MTPENQFGSIHRLSKRISSNMANSLRQIDDINMQVRLLSFNAQVQAAKAGEAGRTFSVVANEIGNLSTKTARVAESLAAETSQDIKELAEISNNLASEVSGNRLVDLALTNIDLIDRNLYERSCDVRWWATDPSVVDALANPSKETHDFASTRLGVILNAYTVYYDIVLCDMNGKIVANGRPEKFKSIDSSAAQFQWFQSAASSASGNDFGFQSVHSSSLVDNKKILAYSCGVRKDGNASGPLLGVLGVLFNWESLAQTIVQATPIPESERDCSRVCIIDRSGLILADTNCEILQHRIPLEPLQSLIKNRKGFAILDTNSQKKLYALACAPGYETYSTGWLGLIIQEINKAEPNHSMPV